MEPFPVTHLHDFLLQMIKKSCCGPVLKSRFMLMRLVHVILPVNCIFTNTVNDNMGMNVTGAIVSIRMSDYQCLIAGKVFPGKFQTKSLGLFSGKSTFCCICWIETDDVVVAFQLFRSSVFLVMSICFHKLNLKSFGITI